MKRPLYHLTLSLIISVLVLPPQTTQAQFGGVVFDPKALSQQIKHYQQLAQQLTTMKGVLKAVEDELKNNDTAAVAMADIGSLIHGALELKNTIETTIKSRLKMLDSIEGRARRGIFDDRQNREDLEAYLRVFGRSSRDTIANQERLSRFDNTLAKLERDWRKANRDMVITMAKRSEIILRIRRSKSDPQLQKCPACITNLIQQVNDLDGLIFDLTGTITDLESKIEARRKKYYNLLDESWEFGDQVNAATDGLSSITQKIRDLNRDLGK